MILLQYLIHADVYYSMVTEVGGSAMACVT